MLHKLVRMTEFNMLLGFKHSHRLIFSKKVKKIPLQAWTGPEGFPAVVAPSFQDNRHMKEVRLSALGTGRLYPPGNNPGTHLCQRLSRPQGHNKAGRFKSTKYSNDSIRNRRRDLQFCGAMPQPTAPPRI